MITLHTKPHIEGGGWHLDRFDAYVDGDHVVLSRQPAYAGARALIANGHDPDTLVVVTGDDRNGNPIAAWPPHPLHELAKWTVTEGKRGGLRRREWMPFGTGIDVDALE